MKKCPNCGTPMATDQKHCLTCDYVERHPKKVCPECGDALVRGVCYRCGYRKRFSDNTCPYCKQKLIAGRCDRCKYTSFSAHVNHFTEKLIIFIIIILIALFFVWRKTGVSLF